MLDKIGIILFVREGFVVADTIKISRWDATEVLETQEDIDLYLEVVFESDDTKQIAKAIENVARIPQ